MQESAFVHPVKYSSEKQGQYIQQWQNDGFLLLDDLFEASCFSKALAQVNEVFPADLPYAKVVDLASKADFGSAGILEFPCRFQEINLLTLDLRLLELTKALLGTSDIRLIQADVWNKYGSEKSFSASDNRDQRMHMDYGNNTMLHPPIWEEPEAVACIISFDDTEKTGGGTSFVPREGEEDAAYQFPYVLMPGMNGYPWINNRTDELAYFKEKDPKLYQFRCELYKREKIAVYKPGSVLIYRHDLWHRGTPVNPGAVRRVQNIGFRRHDCEWVTTWNPGWVREMYDPDTYVERLFPILTVDQRSALGFPAPGHPYWTQTSFAACKARWEPMGMDMSPYRPAKR